uniref:Uncharacterized protein n=1 Tax=Anguilla anguilla TaxID=7936 RepID=A0A0E9QEY0_ANGAN
MEKGHTCLWMTQRWIYNMYNAFLSTMSVLMQIIAFAQIVHKLRIHTYKQSTPMHMHLSFNVSFLATKYSVLILKNAKKLQNKCCFICTYALM